MDEGNSKKNVSSLPVGSSYLRHIKTSHSKPSGLTMTLKPMSTSMNLEKEDYKALLTSAYRALALNVEQIEIANKLNENEYPEMNELIVEWDTIVAGLFIQLFLTLTNEKTTVLFRKQFLCCFMTFAQPREIMAYLITRFCQNENKNIKDIVIRLLDIWTSMTSVQFDENMIETLIVLKNFCKKNGMNLFDEKLECMIGKLRGTNKVDDDGNEKSIPVPIISDSLPEEKWSLQNISPIELARQVTLIHCSIFKQIEPRELLDEVWGDKNSEMSKNINTLVNHFTIFSNYVSLSIIVGESPKSRARTFKNWIDVANAFYELNNFHGMFSVIMGLTHRSIIRMTTTMKYALKTNPKRKTAYNEMLNICDFNNDFQNYRAVIEKAHEPCIPFIGCYQKDLIYVQESFPNKINGLINFKKWQECYKLITIVSNYQRKGYDFLEVPKIQELLLHLPEPTDSKDLMNLSMAKEKKK